MAGKLNRRHAIGAVLIIVFAYLGLWLVAPNGDTLRSLAWGNVLNSGVRPQTTVPHPLAIGAGTILSLPSSAVLSYELWTAFCGLWVLGLLYATYRLAKAFAGPDAGWTAIACGLIATLVVLASARLTQYALTASHDILGAALVLLAIALVAEKPDRPAWQPLALLAAGGLMRPEAWVLAGLYFAWRVAVGDRGRVLGRVAALAAAGPVLWVAFDVIVSGSPTASLHNAADPGSLIRYGYSLDFTGIDRDFAARWLPAAHRSGINNALLDVPSFMGVPILLLGLGGLGFGLRAAILHARDRLKGVAGSAGKARAMANPPAEAVIAVAVLTIALVLAAEPIAGVATIDRYSIPLAAAAAAIAVAVPARLGIPPVAVIVVALLVLLAPFAENHDFLRRDHKQAQLTESQQDKNISLIQLADRDTVRRAIADCPKVTLSGQDRRKIIQGRPLVALAIDRDPEGVRVGRRIVTKEGTSSFRRKSENLKPPFEQSGPWSFRSKCLTKQP